MATRPVFEVTKGRDFGLEAMNPSKSEDGWWMESFTRTLRDKSTSSSSCRKKVLEHAGNTCLSSFHIESDEKNRLA